VRFNFGVLGDEPHTGFDVMGDERLLEFFIEYTKDNFELIRQEQSLQRKMLDELLKFRWQVFGGGVVVSTLVSIAFQFFLKSL
jgi:hypothetical protein